MIRRKKQYLLRLMARCILFSALLVGSALAQNLTRLWSANLATDQDFQRRLSTPEILLRPPTIDFLNDNQIIVSFDDNSISTPSPDLTPFGFHVLEVGAQSGTLGRKLSFKVLVDTSQAEATGDGSILVLAGEELKKFSDSFKQIATIPTPLQLHGQPTEMHFSGRTFLNPGYEYWHMDVAPGGRVFVLAHTKNPHEMELRWVRTSDFAVTATAETQPSSKMSAGSQAVLLFQHSKLMVTSSGHQVPICSRCLRAYFITDDLIFLDERDKYEIKTMSGESRASGSLQQEAFPFHNSMNSSRFVYETGSYRGSGFPLKTHFAAHMAVKVFDWNAMKQVAEISFDEPEKAVSSGFKESAIALSPDGRRLLVLNESTLSCYRLP
jgi:hypothetical protein